MNPDPEPPLLPEPEPPVAGLSGAVPLPGRARPAYRPRPSRSRSPALPAPRAFRPIPVWIIVLLGIGVFAGIGIFLAFVAKDLPVGPKDRAVVVTIEDLEAWFEGLNPKSGAAKLRKARAFDFSYEVEYEYDEPDNDDAPYLSCTVTVERNLREAASSYAAERVGTKAGLFLGGGEAKTVVRNDLFRWGDQSHCSLVVVEGKPVGNVFIARKGRTVFSFFLGGACLDDAESLSGVLIPVLRRVEGYKP